MEGELQTTGIEDVLKLFCRYFILKKFYRINISFLSLNNTVFLLSKAYRTIDPISTHYL
jgi:hypothetical protein